MEGRGRERKGKKKGREGGEEGRRKYVKLANTSANVLHQEFSFADFHYQSASVMQDFSRFQKHMPTIPRIFTFLPRIFFYKLLYPYLVSP